MLIEAASLFFMVSRFDRHSELPASRVHLPSIVVIAIDVEDLVALDTQDTVEKRTVSKVVMSS